MCYIFFDFDSYNYKCDFTWLVKVRFCSTLGYRLVDFLNCNGDSRPNDRPFGYETVYLPLGKVADTPFHIQVDELCHDINYDLWMYRSATPKSTLTLYNRSSALAALIMITALRYKVLCDLQWAKLIKTC